MPTKEMHHNVRTSVEEPLYKVLSEAARRDRVTLSQKVRDLLRRALEIEEDRLLEKIVDDRRTNKAASIPHAAFWKNRGVA